LPIDRAADTPLVQARSLELTYPDGTRALAGIDFTLRRGEVVALIGPSGAGKSTLLRCINGLLRPTAGEVLFDGTSVHSSPARARLVRTRCAMVFQNFGLVPRLSAVTNVLLGQAGRLPWWRGVLFLFRDAERQAALYSLRRVGILEQWAKRSTELSGGQQQRVAIARALHQQPQVLLADEPVSSLDPTTARTVMDHAVRLCREDGIAMVVNLHDVALARAYADRVVALRQGLVLYDGPASGLDEDLLVRVYESTA
jgi:phosphonate transport system ATP-binding protein